MMQFGPSCYSGSVTIRAVTQQCYTAVDLSCVQDLYAVRLRVVIESNVASYVLFELLSIQLVLDRYMYYGMPRSVDRQDLKL